MKRSSTVRRLIIAGATLGVVVGVAGTVLAAGPQDPARVVRVTPNQAMEAVQGLLPLRANDLKAAEPVDGVVDRYYLVTGKGVRAGVDANDGRVTSLLVEGLAPRSGSVARAPIDAAAAATKFFADHGIPTAGLDARTELLNQGDTSVYVAHFQRHVNGVAVPDARTAYVDPANGTVFLMSDFRHAFATPPAPRIGQDQAIATAMTAAGFTDPKLTDSAELTVTFASDGTQLLVWRIALKSPIAGAPASDPIYQHVLVDVDALSGKSSILGNG